MIHTSSIGGAAVCRLVSVPQLAAIMCVIINGDGHLERMMCTISSQAGHRNADDDGVPVIILMEFRRWRHTHTYILGSDIHQSVHRVTTTTTKCPKIFTYAWTRVVTFRRMATVDNRTFSTLADVVRCDVSHDAYSLKFAHWVLISSYIMLSHTQPQKKIINAVKLDQMRC